MSDERLIDDLARKKAKATGALHAAMTVWFIASVGAAAALGWTVTMPWTHLVGDSAPAVLSGLIAAGAMAIMNIPVIVAFELGQKILFELMSLNHAVWREGR